MSHIIYLEGEASLVKTKRGVDLNLDGKICKVGIGKETKYWLYFKFTEQTSDTFGGLRLQQDQYDKNKFYLTDELNKWHGINADGAFSKGRQVFVYNVDLHAISAQGSASSPVDLRAISALVQETNVHI